MTPNPLHTRTAGQQLRLWRETRGLSQTYIANAMGVTVRTVAAWERMQSGIPSTQLARLAPILEISLSRLVAPPEPAPGGLSAALAIASE